MRKSGLGLLFVLAFVLTLGTLLQDFRFDNSLTRDRLAARALDRELGVLEVALSDFRAAQAGYLAAGQGPDFWMRRASELASQIESALTNLRRSTNNPNAHTQYAAALSALGDLVALDKRARLDVTSEQRLLATDLVFTDSLEPAQRLAGSLAAARDAEAAAADVQAARTTRWRFGLNASAMAFVVLVAFAASRREREPAPSPAAATAQMIRDLPPAVKPAAMPPKPVSAAPPPAPLPPPPVMNLPEAADLCVDLARVIDGRDVPSLLERAAKVLEAKGLIIWIVADGGTCLRPSLTHGYSDKVLARLGTLDTEADNVTSLSFRSMRPQTMAAAAGSSGAIAVPLITAHGCAGVLAAEVRESKPPIEMIAVAKILAAQFATVIGPADAVQANAAQG